MLCGCGPKSRGTPRWADKGGNGLMKSRKNLALYVLGACLALAVIAGVILFANLPDNTSAGDTSTLPIAAAALFASLMAATFVIVCFGARAYANILPKKQKRMDEHKCLFINGLFNEYLFQYDGAKDEMMFSEKFGETFGSRTFIERYTQSCENLRALDPADTARFCAFLRGSDGADPIRTTEVRLILPDGHSEWHRVQAATVEIGRDRRLVGKIVCIEREKRERERLIEKANTDPLTGLCNRSMIQGMTEEYLRLRAPGADGTLFLIDVDSFRELNDNLGHSMGDLVLKDIAKALREVFGEDCAISRLGDDEYAVFAADLVSSEQIEAQAEKIRSKVYKIYTYQGKERLVTVSIGAASSNIGDTVFGQIYRRSDKALYNAKIKGKNRLEIFSEKEEADEIGKFDAFPDWGIF